jgi:putative addiction module component (TIGR02574 family)
MNTRARHAEIFQLPVEQRLELVRELWDSIGEEHEAELGLSAEQLAELQRRLALYEAGEMQTYSWDEVRARLQAVRCATSG